MFSCPSLKLIVGRHSIVSSSYRASASSISKYLNKNNDNNAIDHQLHCVSSPPFRAIHDTRQRITLIPGDGIGPEVMAQCKRVLSAMSLPLGYDEFTFSYQRAERDNDAPEDILRSIVKNRISLVGHITPTKDVYLGTPLGIISKLDFFANMTYIRNYPGIETRHSGVNMIILREQSEGEYKRMEHSVWSAPSGTAVEALKIITRDASYRIVKFAFDTATKLGRKKVTLVHKANIMKLGDGMFLKTGREVAQLYPDIEFEDMIIDNMCMQLVWKPQQFDVVVTTNLYGNILENVGAGLVGGVGIVPGEDWSHNQIMFGMGVRHDGGNIAGRGIANPTYMLLSISNMLRKLQFYKQSAALKKAVLAVLEEGKTLTKDLKGSATTVEFVDAVLSKMGKNMVG